MRQDRNSRQLSPLTTVRGAPTAAPLEVPRAGAVNAGTAFYTSDAGPGERRQNKAPTVFLLDVAMEALVARASVPGSLGTYRADVLRVLRVDIPLVSLVLTDLRGIPAAARLDGGRVIRLLVLA